MISKYLQRLDLTNFKAFSRFTLHLRKGPSVILGPNNAGKSTLVASIRLIDDLLGFARRRRPQEVIQFGSGHRVGYALDPNKHRLQLENLRHEMRDRDVRVKATFAEHRVLIAEWPSESGGRSPSYYLDERSGSQPRGPKDVRDKFPKLSVVPPLGPLEQGESLLQANTIKSALDTRVTSRHFRNILAQSKTGEDFGLPYDELMSHLDDWTPEINLTEVRTNYTGSPSCDVFFMEPGHRAEKELAWAGDGLQVWLQLVLHLHRLRDSDIIVLDEPDLYLHADLQRRLVRLLDSFAAQTIVATHSSEIIAESDQSSLIWIDKSRRRSTRASSAEEMGTYATLLGSGFNLGLARALRSRAVVLFEGQDLRLLRIIAGSLGLSSLEAESDVATVPLEGRGNYKDSFGFGGFITGFLDGQASVFVILDRDYWTDRQIKEVEEELSAGGVRGHVWRRKELESYLIVPSAVGRATGMDEEDARVALLEASDALESHVFGQVMSAKMQEVKKGTAVATTGTSTHESFKTSWATESYRLYRTPPKQLLSEFNKLTGESLSPRRLARELRANEIPDEMVDLLGEIEAAGSAWAYRVQ